MAKPNFILNMLTFSHPAEQKEFGLFHEGTDGYFPIRKNELPLELKDTNPELFEGDTEYMYSDFTTTEGAAFTVTVDLTRSIRFAKHYYTWLIRQHFANIADVTNPNFIRDNEIWIKHTDGQNEHWNTYSRFALRVNIGRITNDPELILSYEGDSRVLKQNLLDIDIDTSLIKWVVYNKQRHKYDELPDEARADYENVFPIVNNTLRSALGLEVATKRIVNKYKHYFDHIAHFYDSYLNTPEFKAIIPLHDNGFLSVKDFRIFSTSRDSNKLVFGKNQTSINPYMGVLQNGPCSPSLLAHVDLFFICHEDDKDVANTLMKAFNNGVGNFPSLKKLLRIPININKQDQIAFTNRENPIPEIREQIGAKSYDNNKRYIAIYITPVSKDEKDTGKREYYFRVKEELLKHSITSQVIARNTIEAKNFVYSLPNIAIAILAKLDGVPWRLERSIYSELIVGVGAFKSADTNNRYIGSAFCFSNDGRFQGFECYSANDTYKLAGSIREAVKKYANNHADIKRLVIHFYKTMSNKELQPIREELNDLGLEIPIIIITINKTESKDLVVLDTSFDGLIPVSGTFVSVGRNQYLLCNNTRYSSNGGGKIESYPFPVKISIRASDESVLEDNKTLKSLVDQVYQFSRMYWKSVKQQNLPVTIKYPEMVAEIFPHFESNIIPPFGKDNLWFL